MISGSGIPQLEGEMVGKLEQKWWKVLPAKFVGGFLCLLGGLALGREGPSIQLGAMVGKGISREMCIRDRPRIDHLSGGISREKRSVDYAKIKID